MDVLPRLGEDRFDEVKAVPGLYISGRVPASSPENLLSEGITHIISILKDDELPRKSGSQEGREQFQIKRISIDDDGSEDILIHLDETYEWIENALHPNEVNSDGNSTSPVPQNKVLIHCRQGISRSGAFLIGYMMKKLSLSYSSGLELARTTRPIITPNAGFAKQLRIYEHCKCDIFLLPPTPDLLTDLPVKTSQARTPKAAYTVWKKERDLLRQSDRDVRRVGNMASMAAEFGRRRLVAQARAKEQRASDGSLADQSGVSSAEALRREQQWQRVEDMEKAWNNKLIRGEVQRAKESGDVEELLREVFDSVREEV